MEFTKEEKEFLSALLNQVSIKPTAPDALKTVNLIQAILGKLNG